MRRLALFAIAMLLVIAFVSSQKFYAQENDLPGLQARIQILEKTLNATNTPFKVIGENKVNANGKIVQKITTAESFEIVAIPMIENSQMTYYPNQFKGTLYAGNGYKLTEATSKVGIRLATVLPETSERKLHKFEFINPNGNPVKVRFYYVQTTQEN
jgi:hypothetical protein